jgi:rhodanese-related sulfurtransferase
LVAQNLVRLRELEGTGKVLVAYCDGQGCTKAEELAKILRAEGIRAPGIFADGWMGWMDKGYPVD